MPELTAEKWQELAEKLENELADAEVREKKATNTAGKLVLVALLLLAICIGLLVVFNNQPFAQMAAMPPGLLLLITISYVLRNRRVAEQSRNDADRIRRDIRKWKKKKPADT